MKVYRLGAGLDPFYSLAVSDDTEVDVLRWFDGSPIGSKWKPIAVKPIDEEDRGESLADYTRLGTVPAFSQRAAVELGALLQPNGELLPLDLPRRKYYAYNATRMADVLDEAGSDLQRFQSGKVMMVDRHAFRPDRLGDLTIFKLPQLPRGNVYVTDSFVGRVRDTGLTGFDFEEVWSSVI